MIPGFMRASEGSEMSPQKGGYDRGKLSVTDIGNSPALVQEPAGSWPGGAAGQPNT
jgi:hypothetical protein